MPERRSAEEVLVCSVTVAVTGAAELGFRDVGEMLQVEPADALVQVSVVA